MSIVPPRQLLVEGKTIAYGQSSGVFRNGPEQQHK